MNKGVSALLISLLLAFAAPALAVDSRAGTSTDGILTNQDGARPAGMGGAYTAVSDDINAIYRNPGGLGFLTKMEVAGTRFSGVSQLNANDIAVALPLGDVSAGNVRNMGVLAFDL